MARVVVECDMPYYKPVPPWLDFLMLNVVCAGFAGLVGGAWFALAVVVMILFSYAGGWLLERRGWTPPPPKQTWVYDGDADTPRAPTSKRRDAVVGVLVVVVLWAALVIADVWLF